MAANIKRQPCNLMRGFWLCILFGTLDTLVQKVIGVDLYYTLEVGFSFANPDAYGTRLIYSGNGSFPGPTIRATAGDILHITVFNHLFQEGTTIHWHGITQNGTPYYDGVAGVSQCAILPGTNVTYIIDTTGNLGTHWWHAHYIIQVVASLYGPLIIDPAPPIDDKVFLGYDEELEPPMMLGDWYHTSLNSQEYNLLNVNGWLWPSSGLINGRGVFNCSPTAVSPCVTSNITSNYTVMNVVAGKRYRLRIINAASQAFYSFVIEGHELTIVEADGLYVKPTTVTSLDVSAGQSYSVLFTADQEIGNYWIAGKVQFVTEDFGVSAVGILQYEGAPEAEPPRELPSTHPAWNDTSFSLAQILGTQQRLDVLVPVPLLVDREITIVLAQTIVDGIFLFSVNNKTLQLPSTPYILQQTYGILNNTIDYSYDQPPIYNYLLPLPAQNITENGDQGTIIYTVEKNQVIQVVLQNTVNDDLLSADHPWHLHGHDFWVVGSGLGIYDEETSPLSFNLINPVRRNTVSVLPSGWAAVRFIADNPAQRLASASWDGSDNKFGSRGATSFTRQFPRLWRYYSRFSQVQMGHLINHFVVRRVASSSLGRETFTTA